MGQLYLSVAHGAVVATFTILSLLVYFFPSEEGTKTKSLLEKYLVEKNRSRLKKRAENIGV